VLEGVTLNGAVISSLAEAGVAAQSFGPGITVYSLDNNATLWVVEQGNVGVG
jgi:hypothetical protein